MGKTTGLLKRWKISSIAMDGNELITEKATRVKLYRVEGVLANKWSKVKVRQTATTLAYCILWFCLFLIIYGYLE